MIVKQAALSREFRDKTEAETIKLRTLELAEWEQSEDVALYRTIMVVLSWFVQY